MLLGSIPCCYGHPGSDCITWCYFMTVISYQPSTMLNSAVQPVPFLVYEQFGPVAKVHFPVIMDILVQIVSLGTILCLCWIMLLKQLHSLHMSNYALLLGSSALLLWPISPNYIVSLDLGMPGCFCQRFFLYYVILVLLLWASSRLLWNWLRAQFRKKQLNTTIKSMTSFLTSDKSFIQIR